MSTAVQFMQSRFFSRLTETFIYEEENTVLFVLKAVHDTAGHYPGGQYFRQSLNHIVTHEFRW